MRTWRTRFTRDQLIQLGLATEARMRGLEQGLKAATEDARRRINYWHKRCRRQERAAASLRKLLRKKNR